MNRKFEETLFWFGSCTLKRIKPASMFSCKRKDYDNLDEVIKYYQDFLKAYGLELEVIQEKETYVLLYLYRKNHLEKIWNSPKAKEFLFTRGYETDVMTNLSILKNKLLINNDFPHDIGIFLGYAVDDVESFIKHEGKNYELIGPWKVYHQKDKKEKIFSMLNKTTNQCLDMFYSGHDLCQFMQA